MNGFNVIKNGIWAKMNSVLASYDIFIDHFCLRINGITGPMQTFFNEGILSTKIHDFGMVN